MIKLSIIMPAYNEEKRIGKTLEEYGKFFTNLKKIKILDFEILIVLNACKDNTVGVVKEFQKKIKEIRYLDFEQGGKGFAIIQGFKDALKRNNDLIGFVDADMATSPEDFSNLVKNCKFYDGIIASRYVKGAIVNPKQPVQRIIASRIFNTLVRTLFLFSYRDTQCGAKLFKKRCLKKIIMEIGETEWAFDVDLLYLSKKNKFKIKEYPTVWKEPGASKLNLKKASIQMFLAVIQLRIINTRFKKTWWFFGPIARLLKKIVE